MYVKRNNMSMKSQATDSLDSLDREGIGKIRNPRATKAGCLVSGTKIPPCNYPINLKINGAP